MSLVREPKTVAAALADTFPDWRFLQHNGRWVAARAPHDVPVDELLSGDYDAFVAKTFDTVLQSVRDARTTTPIRKAIR